jgi:hypothetical protein
VPTLGFALRVAHPLIRTGAANRLGLDPELPV